MCCRDEAGTEAREQKEQFGLGKYFFLSQNALENKKPGKKKKRVYWANPRILGARRTTIPAVGKARGNRQ
jgi:hypothetical protein